MPSTPPSRGPSAPDGRSSACSAAAMPMVATVEALEHVRAVQPLPARVAARPQPPPAQRLPHVQRRPSPPAHRGQRRRARAHGRPSRPAPRRRPAPRHRQGLPRRPHRRRRGAGRDRSCRGWGSRPRTRRRSSPLVEHHLLLAETATGATCPTPDRGQRGRPPSATLERLEPAARPHRGRQPRHRPVGVVERGSRLAHRPLVASVGRRGAARARAAAGDVDVEERFGALLDAGPRSAARLRDRARRAPASSSACGSPRRTARPVRQVAGTLALHRVDVTGADAWTSADGIAVEQFHILPTCRRPAAVRPSSSSDLVDVLAGRLDVAARLDASGSQSAQRATAGPWPRRRRGPRSWSATTPATRRR